MEVVVRLPLHLDVLLEGEGTFVPAAGGAFGLDAFPGEGNGGVGVGGGTVAVDICQMQFSGRVASSRPVGKDIVFAVGFRGVRPVPRVYGNAAQGVAMLVGDGAVDVELGVGTSVFAYGRLLAAPHAEESECTGDELAFG